MVDSSSNLGGMYTSNLRVSGMASGMDVDGMVKKMMMAESVPLDKMKQQQQYLTWQRDDYRSMNTLLDSLRSVNTTMRRQGTFLTKNTTSTNESVVTATANVNAGTASYTVSNVKMATAAHNASNGKITSDTKYDPSVNFYENTVSLNNSFTWDSKSQTDNITIAADKTTTVKLNVSYLQKETTPTVKVNGTTFNVVADPSQLTNDNDVYVDKKNGSLTFKKELNKDDKVEATYQYKTADFGITTYNDSGTGKETKFTINEGMSLNDVMTMISSSGAGVSAFYDSGTQQVSMTRTATGNLNTSGGHEMEFSGDFLTGALLMDATKETDGTDAELTVNGLTTTRHSNTVSLGSVTLNIKGNSQDSNPITVGVSNNTEDVFNQIKTFVDKYNDTIQQINDKLSEAKYRDYSPLTDAQKQDMSDSDIKLWEEKAKSGTLRGDSLLSGVLNRMRANIYAPVSSISDSKHNQLAQFGIKTSSNYLDHGKLVIEDEGKLKQTIAENPDAVMKLFTSNGATSSEQGIAQRLEKTISDAFNQIKTKAGNTGYTTKQYSMGVSFDDLDQRIQSMTDKLTAKENYYYKQFSAMEDAIQRANQQSSSLLSFLNQ